MFINERDEEELYPKSFEILESLIISIINVFKKIKDLDNPQKIN